MKRFIPFFIVLLIYSCKTSVKSESESISITSTELESMVTYLASDELIGRDTGSEGIDKAAHYLENQLKSYNVKPYFETYRDPFKVGELDAFNVVGVIEGNDAVLKDEFVIIGAHYDHIGISKKIVENDSIANGANDNAAGTSSVLAMAKYFAAKKNNKRSLMFVFFSAEEKGLLGSKHLAEKLKSENLDLYSMVNMEMIGVPFVDRDYVAFVTGYGKSNMASKMNEYLGSNILGFSEISKKYNLFRQSDNFAFYDAFKLPCHTISSCDLSNYDYYHHVDDEADKLDYQHMADLINRIIPGIEKMSNTATKEIVLNDE
ncbi:M20/M25/M40 family metallo-hydrolase [Winogradskyella psychrotolerans]|uniref:M20/M25/M40 family metallo-hydrolase n=1 Tax=Winogradskyella psychrotolerans TaxID=1344585 RepID=UPI001C074189|nr:M20/M25/M40 family metallo-hydrolase [Winogradskyella psychrotolerans]MBU2928812.1 M20/M25/M40 family metallo-hydrolase [Winogradskyella psychrotolerans]